MGHGASSLTRDQIQGNEKICVISDVQLEKHRRFLTSARVLTVRILDHPDGVDPVEWLEAALFELVDVIKSGRDNTYVGLKINSDKFEKGAGWLSFRPVERLTAESLWSLVFKITQSNQSFQVDESFQIDVTYIDASEAPWPSVDQVNGKGGVGELLDKHGVLNLKNTDNLCLPRAIVCGLVHVEKTATDSWKKRWARIKSAGVQTDAAKNILREAGVVLPNNEGCGMLELKKFQRYLALEKNIRLRVYEYETFGKGTSLVYDGEIEYPGENYKIINIMFYTREKHFNLITNLLAVKAQAYFCEKCNTTYRQALRHSCKNVCARCNATPNCALNPAEGEQTCDDCRRTFLSRQCFENHKKEGSYARNPGRKNAKRSVCEFVKICPICYKLYDLKKKKHQCGVIYCKLCRSRHGVNDRCFIVPLKNKERLRDSAKHPETCFVFYDLETRLEKKDNVDFCVPNLCVAQLCCDACADNNDMKHLCNYCGVREHVFQGTDCVEKFVNFVVRPRRKTADKQDSFSSFVCIAHNSRSFDAQFILKTIVAIHKNIKPSIILNGRNIIKIQAGITRFIDSLSFLPTKLATFEKTFDLPPGNKKGYFPHLFNKIENENYIGAYPDVWFYAPDAMSSQERQDFLVWHSEMVAQNAVFDFSRELLEYCTQDVSILRQACIKFRDIFIKVGDVDPFDEAVTIASACSVLYRKKFLKRKTIGLIPAGGYTHVDQQSQKAIDWLLWQERKVGREIIHAARGREYRLLEGARVDGYLAPSDATAAGKGTVYQFHGCFFHGCPRCFPNNRDEPRVNGCSFNERYETTLNTSKKIKWYGYNLIEMWECDFEREVKPIEEFLNFIKKHPLAKKDVTLNPRDAFFGGRTGNIVTKYFAADGEKIKYVDVCSLYPFVCKTGKFPVGHPSIYAGEEACKRLAGENFEFFNEKVEGLVKCTVLPPRNLFHPVLPVRMHNRLLFALCRTCATTSNAQDCNHENICDRVFTGTWVSDELKKALELGYKLIKINVIWQYKVCQYDPTTRRGGLFAEYIDTFLKIKQEASGWPSNVKSEAEKENYLREYYEKEGIVLDREKISKNAGLRSVAKLCLNSFWGKFGQRDNLPQTEIIHNHKHLLKLLKDVEKETCAVTQVDDYTVYASWRFIDESVLSSPCTSVVIAAYCTAQARLNIFSHLHKLGKRVLYYDTDSVVYTSKGGEQYEPPTGPFLGDLPD